MRGSPLAKVHKLKKNRRRSIAPGSVTSADGANPGINVYPVYGSADRSFWKSEWLSTAFCSLMAANLHQQKRCNP